MDEGLAALVEHASQWGASAVLAVIAIWRSPQIIKEIGALWLARKKDHESFQVEMKRIESDENAHAERRQAVIPARPPFDDARPQGQ